jgi:4-hydroxy-2-oxoheptanedioate aldolase
MSRIFERLERDEPAIGTFVHTHGPEWVELLAEVGLDHVCLDFMLTSLDWNEAANMIRAGERYGLDSIIRLQAYPWASGASDTHVPSDTLRALSIGATGVMASVNTPEQVEAMIRPASDWHRRIHLQGLLHLEPLAPEDYDALVESIRNDSLVFPLIESLEALQRLDEILAVENLRAIFLGMGDLSRELGHPSDDQHPEMRELVRTVVRRGEDRGVMVFANTLGSTPDRIRSGIDQLVDAGVRVIWIAYPTIAVETFYRGILQPIRERTRSEAAVGTVNESR